MSDPVTLSIAGVGAVALKEGITFLYSQAGEILKEWRKRKDNPELHTVEPKSTSLPDVFDGQLENPSIDYATVTALEPRLRTLYRDLSEYATDVEPVKPEDSQLLRTVDELRRCLEAVFDQHITFKGENRSRSGTIVAGHVRAKIIAGEAIGVEGEGTGVGDVQGTIDASKIERGAKATGVKWRA
jgi:hypothetical protein